jgi:hypothetical protein
MASSFEQVERKSKIPSTELRTGLNNIKVQKSKIKNQNDRSKCKNFILPLDLLVV